jgi:hypothetical protein
MNCPSRSSLFCPAQDVRKIASQNYAMRSGFAVTFKHWQFFGKFADLTAHSTRACVEEK